MDVLPTCAVYAGSRCLPCKQQLFAMCAHCCMAYYTTQQYNSTQCVHILSCIALPAPRKHQNTGVATCKISSSVPQFTYVPILCARTAKNHRSDQYLTGSPNQLAATLGQTAISYPITQTLECQTHTHTLPTHKLHHKPNRTEVGP